MKVNVDHFFPRLLLAYTVATRLTAQMHETEEIKMYS
jgi:hypothetical protein